MEDRVPQRGPGARGTAPVGGLEVPHKLRHFCKYNDKFCQYVEGYGTTFGELKTAVYASQELHTLSLGQGHSQ